MYIPPFSFTGTSFLASCLLLPSVLLSPLSSLSEVQGLPLCCLLPWIDIFSAFVCGCASGIMAMPDTRPGREKSEAREKRQKRREKEAAGEERREDEGNVKKGKQKRETGYQ